MRFQLEAHRNPGHLTLGVQVPKQYLNPKNLQYNCLLGYIEMFWVIILPTVGGSRMGCDRSTLDSDSPGNNMMTINT